MEHFNSGVKSIVSSQNHEGRAVRGLKMILSPGAKTRRKKWCTGLKKNLNHWVVELTDKIS
jgi:hypothetical protein